MKFVRCGKDHEDENILQSEWSLCRVRAAALVHRSKGFTNTDAPIFFVLLCAK